MNRAVLDLKGTRHTFEKLLSWLFQAPVQNLGAKGNMVSFRAASIPERKLLADKEPNMPE